MVFEPINAMIDMRSNLIAAAVVLVVGVMVFRFVRSSEAESTSRNWLPMVAFFTGPLVGFLWTVADVLWIQPYSYLNFAEYIDTLVPVLIVGVIGGSVGAFAFWVGDRLNLQ
jgi:hypothetical protein